MEIDELTICRALEEYLFHCRFERKLEGKTISAYKVDLLQLARKVGPDTPILEVSRDAIKDWMESLGHFKHKTIKRKIASAMAFMHYLEVEYDAFENPFRRLQIKVKSPIQLPRVLTGAEVKKMLDCLRQEDLLALDGGMTQMIGARNLAIVELLFGTGMRIGELCALNMEDVDLVEGRVRIHGKGNKERMVDICPQDTLGALHEWTNKYSGLHDAPFFINRFGGRLSPQSVRLLLHGLARKCEIGKNVTPHMFRHTFASLLLEEDVDVAYIQRILGHSSIATTQIYLHVNPRRQREILQQHHPRLRM